MTTEAQPSPPKVSRRLSAMVNFVFHHVNTLLVITQGIILAPLYVAKVSQSLYGAWLATGNILSWIELVDPGISAVLTQRVASLYGAGDLERLSRAIGTGLVVGLAMSALPLLAWPLAGALGASVNVSPAELPTLVWAFRMGLVGTAVTLASYVSTAALLGLHLSLRAGLVFTSAAVVGIASTVAMLLSGVGLASIPLGLLVRGSILAIANTTALLVWCARHLPDRLSFDREELRYILGTSLYTFASRLGVTLAGRVDAFLSATMLGPAGPAQTTVLVFTGRAADPGRMVAASFGGAIQSGVAHLAGEGNHRRAAEVIVQAGRAVSIVVVTSAACVVALNHAFIAVWVGPRFDGGLRLTVLLAFAVGLSTFTASINQLAFALGGMRSASMVGLAEAVLKVTLQVALVGPLGLVAFPLASIAASLAVPLWLMPRVTAKLVGVDAGPMVRFWLAQALRLALGCALGAAASLALRAGVHAWTRPRFALAALGVGAAFGALNLATDPAARAVVVARVRRRAAAP